jgi:hypothetical protein
MRINSLIFTVIFLVATVSLCFGQQAQTPPSPNAPFYTTDPIPGIIKQLNDLHALVEALSHQVQAIAQKFETVGKTKVTDKEHKMLVGLDLLARAEDRVAMLQKTLMDYTIRLDEASGRLSQVEVELHPNAIDRTLNYTGTTVTDDLREATKTRLETEKASLEHLIAQIQTNSAETTHSLQEAQQLVARLRAQFLPQIDGALSGH